MKVRIHRDRIREIICEELDRIDTIYEKVAGGYGGLGGISGFGMSGTLSSNETDECDIEKESSNKIALHPSVRKDFESIAAQLNKLTNKDEFSEFKGKIKLVTYRPYSGEGPFNLINAVNPDDNCAGSYSCRIAIGAGKRLSNAAISFYQAAHKAVKKSKSWKMKEELPTNVDADNALNTVSSTTDIKLMIANEHPSVQDLLATWELVKQGKEPCPGVVGADAEGVADSILGGGGESGAKKDMEAKPGTEPCPEPPGGENEEEAAKAVPVSAPPPNYPQMAQRISGGIVSWWKGYGEFFAKFKGTWNDDEVAAFSKYKSSAWPADAVAELDDTHRSILNQVLDDIEEQITDTIINDVAWHVDGVEYVIDDNDLDF